MTERQTKRIVKRVEDEIRAFVTLAWTVISEESWSYKEIHQSGGPTPQTISRLLNLETKSPHFATLVKIGIALRLQISWDQVNKDILKLQAAGVRRAA